MKRPSDKQVIYRLRELASTNSNNEELTTAVERVVAAMKPRPPGAPKKRDVTELLLIRHAVQELCDGGMKPRDAYEYLASSKYPLFERPRKEAEKRAKWSSVSISASRLRL